MDHIKNLEQVLQSQNGILRDFKEDAEKCLKYHLPRRSQVRLDQAIGHALQAQCILMRLSSQRRELHFAIRSAVSWLAKKEPACPERTKLLEALLDALLDEEGVESDGDEIVGPFFVDDSGFM